MTIIARGPGWSIEWFDKCGVYEFSTLNRDGSSNLRFYRSLADIVCDPRTPESVVDALSGKPVQDDDCDT